MENSSYLLVSGLALVLSVTAICLTIIVGVIAGMAYARLYSTHQVQMESLGGESPVDMRFADLGDDNGESPDFQKIEEDFGYDMDGRKIGEPRVTRDEPKVNTGAALVKNLAEAVYGLDPSTIILDPLVKKRKEEEARDKE